MNACNRLNWSRKAFFYLKLLKTYETLDFTVATGSAVYIWWRHQKNADVSKNIFIYSESMVVMVNIITKLMALTFLNQKLR